MIQEIKHWWRSRRQNHTATEVRPQGYSREQLEKAYMLGYTDGKRDGLNIARYQATQSLKEILRQQNGQPKL